MVWFDSKHACRFRGICQFVVGERRAVPHGIGPPGAAVQVHQGKQQSGIDATAQKQAHRNVADELAPNRPLIDGQQLLPWLLREILVEQKELA